MVRQRLETNGVGTPVVGARSAHARTRTRVAFHPGRRDAFLAALASGISVADAALVAGVARRTVYKHRQFDAAFAEAWECALEVSVEQLEDRLEEIVFKSPRYSLAAVKAAEVLLRGRSDRYR